jgi:hypothetical protein
MVVFRLGLGDVPLPTFVLLLVLVGHTRRNRSREMPIWQDPRTRHWVGADADVDADVHFRTPSDSKIFSCLETAAGVGGGLDVDEEDCWADGGAACWISLLRLRLWRSRAGSDSSKVEKTMFARCLLRLVIWTARTAA